MSAWRLLLTRPAEENPPLAAALDTVGIATASLPLLELQPLAETPEQRSLWLDLDRYAARINGFAGEFMAILSRQLEDRR